MLRKKCEKDLDYLERNKKERRVLVLVYLKGCCFGLSRSPELLFLGK